MASRRLPQQDRSVATRARLIDATVETLAKRRYANTTTVEVCRRAKASRGMLLHHFPTHQALVVTSMQHVLARRIEEFREAFLAVPAGARTLDLAVDIGWKLYSGPTFYAWLELLVASRTDAPLHRAVRRVIRSFEEQSNAIIHELLPELSSMPLGAKTMRAVFPLLNGLALDRIHGDEGEIREVLGLLKRLGSLGKALFPAD